MGADLKNMGHGMRPRRAERSEALIFMINMHTRLKLMVFVTEQVLELSSALLCAKRLKYQRRGIRVGFLFTPRVQYILAGGLPLTPTV